MGGGNKQQQAPETPPAFSYKQGIKDQVKYTPQLLAAQIAAQKQYGGQEAQNLVDQYSAILPQVAARNLKAYKSVDPESYNLRKQYSKVVGEDLGHGTDLGPDLERQVQQYIRGAQTARGNSSGAANVSAEGAFKGQAALDLEQRRLGNVDAFLRAPTPEDRFGELLGGAGPAVSGQLASNVPDVSQMYSPGLGLQLAQDDYTSNLNQWSSMYNPAGAAGGANPWMRALNGASSGASFGGNFGPWGSLIGGAAGAVEGYANGPITKNPQLQQTLAGSGGGMMGGMSSMMGGGAKTGASQGVGAANWYSNAKGYG